MQLDLFTETIDDRYSRDNFKRLNEAIRNEALLRGEFRFFEITVDKAVTGLDWPHSLRFKPRDVILTSVSNGADVFFVYDAFTLNTIRFTTTDACTFRCFIGTYR